MMRPLLSVSLVLALAGWGMAGDKATDRGTVTGWRYPEAEVLEESRSAQSATQNGQTERVVFSSGQYRSAASFREVLAFYIAKSGLKVPNETIVGRDFPGDKICIPAQFFEGDVKGQNVNVTLLHNIRPTAATATMLISNHPEAGSLTITISRGDKEDATSIHLVQHPRKYMK